MKIPEVRFVQFRSKRNFGIELEVNEKLRATDLVKIVSETDKDRTVIHSPNYQQDSDNNYWHVKFDRSCGDVKGKGGWEVASYKANGYKDVENMGRVADALRIGGAKVNDECGFHIHAEIADFKHNMAATLAAYWLKIESVILEILPKHRKNNKYAKPMARIFDYPLNKVYTWEEFWARVRPQNLDNTYRRVALNLCNYCHWHANRRTVELRLPEGTLDGKEVKNWIRFYLTFVDNVRKMPFPENLEAVSVYDAMKIIGLHNEDPFLILSKGMRDTKIWFMKRILTYSSKKKFRDEASKFLNALEITSAEETSGDEDIDNLKRVLKTAADVMWWKRA